MARGVGSLGEDLASARSGTAGVVALPQETCAKPPSFAPAPQYIDAIRFGDLYKFKKIEKASEGWWFPTLDRGGGAALHFAVDHGQVRGPALCCADK